MNSKLNKIIRLFRDRREWAPRLIRGHMLFHFTHLFRLVFPFPNNIHLKKNVRLQWPTSLLAELPGSSITIGKDSVIYENAMIEAYGAGAITIGDSCVIGDNRIYSRGKISIGNRVVTSWNVFIQDFDPHPVDPVLRAKQIEKLSNDFEPRFFGARKYLDNIDFDFSPREIEIGDDVWLGANALILKGVKIGRGSIVAAGAVVTKGEYPEKSVIAGNPARVVKQLG
jgi:acetyltransferase-like isoleucine patch superfamily enzyme